MLGSFSPRFQPVFWWRALSLPSVLWPTSIGECWGCRQCPWDNWTPAIYWKLQEEGRGSSHCCKIQPWGWGADLPNTPCNGFPAAGTDVSESKNEVCSLWLTAGMQTMLTGRSVCCYTGRRLLEAIGWCICSCSLPIHLLLSETLLSRFGSTPSLTTSLFLPYLSLLSSLFGPVQWCVCSLLPSCFSLCHHIWPGITLLQRWHSQVKISPE